jgi:hypothetical protein
LHVLRRLESALAESLIGGDEQLAVAARRFPNGTETIPQEAERRRTATGAACSGGFVIGGNPRDFPYMES